MSRGRGFAPEPRGGGADPGRGRGLSSGRARPPARGRRTASASAGLTAAERGRSGAAPAAGLQARRVGRRRGGPRTLRPVFTAAWAPCACGSSEACPPPRADPLCSPALPVAGRTPGRAALGAGVGPRAVARTRPSPARSPGGPGLAPRVGHCVPQRTGLLAAQPCRRPARWLPAALAQPAEDPRCCAELVGSPGQAGAGASPPRGRRRNR